LGRTDVQQSGLVIFKKRWGRVESAISYSRYTNSAGWAHSFEWQDELENQTDSLSFHIRPTDFFRFWVTFCTDILAEDSPAPRGPNQGQDLQTVTGRLSSLLPQKLTSALQPGRAQLFCL